MAVGDGTEAAAADVENDTRASRVRAALTFVSVVRPVIREAVSPVLAVPLGGGGAARIGAGKIADNGLTCAAAAAAGSGERLKRGAKLSVTETGDESRERADGVGDV